MYVIRFPIEHLGLCVAASSSIFISFDSSSDFGDICLHDMIVVVYCFLNVMGFEIVKNHIGIPLIYFDFN